MQNHDKLNTVLPSELYGQFGDEKSHIYRNLQGLAPYFLNKRKIHRGIWKIMDLFCKIEVFKKRSYLWEFYTDLNKK